MFFSLHNHTYRCNHATGTEREYVENAIKAGYRVIGFSDHAPMPFENDYVSPFRMDFRQYDDYITVLSDLKREYAGQIEIRIGLEAEYYPKLFPRFLDRIKGTPIEYLILGQHFTHNELDGVRTADAQTSPELMTYYVDQLIEGIDTGVFTYVAHPDVFHLIGHRDFYRNEMLRLCRHAMAASLPLEINFLGLWDQRHYPCSEYLEALGMTGCSAIYGCDAHSADKVYQPDTVMAAKQLVDHHQINLLSSIPLRHPHARKDLS